MHMPIFPPLYNVFFLCPVIVDNQLDDINYFSPE